MTRWIDADALRAWLKTQQFTGPRVLAKMDELEGQRPPEQAENLELRRLLWLWHGHDGLYGDDGEMQCGRCLVDFKRMPPDQILHQMQKKPRVPEQQRAERIAEARRVLGWMCSEGYRYDDDMDVAAREYVDSQGASESP